MKILVTGTAGFIGYHVAKYLLERGDEVVGLDNINDYYDVNLKYSRLEDCGIDCKSIKYNIKVLSDKYDNYSFYKIELADKEAVENLFESEKFDRVCHLAAQAGVRYSLTNPHAYIHGNVEGTLNILEGCRHNRVENLVYASSSSVYGLNTKQPFSEHHIASHPVSLYGASKRSCELMAHSYSDMYNIPTTGLRFFSVYGPFGRPDMALFLFTKAIYEQKTMQVFNNGDMERDFTYIDDIVKGVVHTIDNIPKSSDSWNSDNPDPAYSKAPYKVYNIGNCNPVPLMDFVNEIEDQLGKKAIIDYKPMQPGDARKNWADCSDLENDFNYKPDTNFKEGVKAFIEWYKDYYKLK